MTLYVYRVIVTSWPTPDERPWNRIYGDPHGYRNSGPIDPYEEHPEDIPEWLDRLIDQSTDWRVLQRVHEDTDRDIRLGVVMPKVSRRHYLSASGAHELARDMRAFGATVDVIRSEAVRWPDA